MIKRFLPFLKWYEGYNYNGFKDDFIAGLTVALVLIPQSMAYAQLAGLPAYYGLYAAFLPPMIASLFGSSNQLATGPVAVVSLMTSASLEPLATAGSGQFIAYAILLALMVGVFQFLLGALRLGIVVNLLAHPVIIGFTNAAAIIIATSQLSKIFGVYVDKAEHHYETIYRVIESAIHYTHIPTLGIAALAFAIMIGLKRINPRLPNVLIAAVITILIARFTGFENNRTVQLSDIHSSEIREIIKKYNFITKEIDIVSRVEKEFSIDSEAISENLRVFHRPEEFCSRCHSERNFLDIQAAFEKEAELSDDELNHLVHTSAITSEYKGLLKEKSHEYRKKLRSTQFEIVQNSNGVNQIFIKGIIPKDSKSSGGTWRIKVKNTAIDESSILLTAGGDVVGTIPKGLPKLSFPDLDFTVIPQLIMAMIIISLLGFMEAISIAKAMATRTGQRLDPNQELIGQGLANIIGSVGQSYPVSGSFSRSAVNLQAGGITGFSNVLSALFVAITLIFFTPLLYFLPQAVLAAIIMMAVIGLINVRSFVHSFHTQKYEGLIAVVTFISTLFFAPHLDRGIMIGLFFSVGYFIIRRIEPGVAILSKHWDNTFRNAERFGLEECRYISLIRFRGSLTFASCSYLEEKVLQQISVKPELKYILIVGNAINEIDASGEGMLSALIPRLQDSKFDIFFSGLNDSSLDVFRRTGLYDKLGEDHFFRNATFAVDAIHAKAHEGSEEKECPLLTPVVIEK
jgi:MFS superfamily sulfate permease-like transporter